MICPRCGGRAVVVDSRTYPTGEVRRRRKCRRCGHRFSTLEAVVKFEAFTVQVRRNDMLTGNEIKLQVAAGRIVIQPFDEENIGPNSYDVHLSDELLAYTEAVLDPRKDNRYWTFKIPSEGLVLEPGRVYLGKTVEYTESPYHIPMYEGRSSLGRLGVFSHVSAGFGDIGFRGNWTLEFSVVQPVRIYPGLRIGQLYWHNPDGEVLKRYDGKYQGQTAATPSRLFQDREWEEE